MFLGKGRKGRRERLRECEFFVCVFVRGGGGVGGGGLLWLCIVIVVCVFNFCLCGLDFVVCIIRVR